MSTHIATARAPRGAGRTAVVTTDAAAIAAHLEDAAHVPGGQAAGVVYPRDEGEIASALRQSVAVLPVGAQSSLTGGATPMGSIVLSTARMTAIDLTALAEGQVVVEPGVTLAALDAALAGRGCWYPPSPTYTGATVGGTIATNAAGAATFKYGSTRPWVAGLTVVLADGDVLDLRRGVVSAHPDGYFEIRRHDSVVRVEVPGYRWPAVPKVSAGYFAAPGMDLVDLFIGAEGTLGVVSSVTLRVASPRPTIAMALIFCPSRAVALRLVDDLRRHSRQTWQSADPAGLDVSAIEHMDARCLALLREDGVDRRWDITVPAGTELALLVTLELAAGLPPGEAFAQIGRALDPGAADTPLTRFCRLLAAAGLLDTAELALPGDRRQAAFLAFREAVPAAVNQRIGLAQRLVDARVEKVAADVIVPFERLEELLLACGAEFAARGLDGAVWGHISDGNLHPNVIPRDARDLDEGKAAVLALGRVALALGGAPCAEHGVGRNRVKQRLMAEMVGDAGIAAMRRIKQAFDPAGRLAPGVLGL